MGPTLRTRAASLGKPSSATQARASSARPKEARSQEDVLAPGATLTGSRDEPALSLTRMLPAEPSPFMSPCVDARHPTLSGPHQAAAAAECRGRDAPRAGRSPCMARRFVLATACW